MVLFLHFRNVSLNNQCSNKGFQKIDLKFLLSADSYFNALAWVPWIRLTPVYSDLFQIVEKKTILMLLTTVKQV